MKKIFLSQCFLLLLLCSCSSNGYQKKLDACIDKMESQSELLESIAKGTLSVWYGVISDKEYDGHYCDDINVAIDKHLQSLKETDGLDKVLSIEKEIDSEMIALRDAPSSCREAYDLAVSIYGDLKELFKYSVEPAGSYFSYKGKIVNGCDGLNRKISEYHTRYYMLKKNE